MFTTEMNVQCPLLPIVFLIHEDALLRVIIILSKVVLYISWRIHNVEAKLVDSNADYRFCSMVLADRKT